jgi:ATP-dependent RNA helicase DDX5/DBP2
MTAADEKAKKAEKKAKLKAEAEKLGITYDELKKQKKEKKESRRNREADKLSEVNEDRQQEKKRMRSWSGDFGNDKKENDEVTKRVRTRSMDKAEENAKIVQDEKRQSTEEWRKSHNISIRGYGKRANEKFPDPFIEFDDAPFNPTIQKTLKAAGFTRPTFIQSQVNKIGFVFSLSLPFLRIHLTHIPSLLYFSI